MGDGQNQRVLVTDSHCPASYFFPPEIPTRTELNRTYYLLFLYEKLPYYILMLVHFCHTVEDQFYEGEEIILFIKPKIETKTKRSNE